MIILFHVAPLSYRFGHSRRFNRIRSETEDVDGNDVGATFSRADGLDKPGCKFPGAGRSSRRLGDTPGPGEYKVWLCVFSLDNFSGLC